MYLLTNERYITFQTGFSFGRLGHAQGWDLGVPWGGGGGGGGGGGVGLGAHFFFPKFNQILCVSYSHEWHMHRHNIWGHTPWGLREGSKIKFLNMVMWHIKLKGMSSRPGYTEIF